MSEWRPIETAPKDGKAILAYLPGRHHFVARQDVQPVYWSGWGGGIWEGTGSGAKYSTWEVTHWMPIPPPPDEQVRTNQP